MRPSSILLLSLTSALAQSPGPLAFFESRVRPVFAKHCYACHSAQARTPFAGLRLDSREAILRGGDRGPAIVPGSPDQSRLVSAIRHQTLQMPPTGKLAPHEIEAIVQWIDAGAPWPQRNEPTAAPGSTTPSAPDHWAWQPIRQSFPEGASIDSLVRARLASAGLQPSTRAPHATLLRRLSYDLTGLPPSLTLESEPNYTAAVDRLLDSPHFGERWARHWLDLARFSDAGFNNIRFAFAHTYRDWVIDAFNRDLPYNTFVTYQLAADLVAQIEPKHLAALGFLSLGFDPHRPTGLPEKIDDRIDTVSRTFLGLTVSCARCHDHKYDPIPTRDYYSLYGVFTNSRESIEPTPVTRHFTTPFDTFYGSRLRLRLDQLAGYKRQRLDEHRADAREPEAVLKYCKAAYEGRSLSAPQLENLAKERNLNHFLLTRWCGLVNSAQARSLATPEAFLASGLWKRTQHTPGDPAEISLDDFGEVQTEGDYNTTNTLLWQYRKVLADYSRRGAPAHAMSVADAPLLRPAHVFIRGNSNDPAEAVPRRFLSLLSHDKTKPFEHGSGRLELAQAITGPGNPLTARVLVNRVWMHLFGEGLVRTPSDFGTRGEPPSHPGLLDYLATTFRNDGWSVKRLIRRIVLSETYRQSSRDNPAARAKDPENHLLWRMNRRRLDFESLRDSILAAAGTLDRTIGGPSFYIGAVPADPRRTLYAFVERERAQALLKSFNYADPEQHTPRRHLTTVPQQALFLLNSSFLGEQARRLAERSKDIPTLYRNALGRVPSAAELEAARSLLRQSEPPAHAPSPTPWQFGAGALDPAAGRVIEFRPFRYFADNTWQASSLRPHPTEGNAHLTSNGGAPGDNLSHAVIRRWVAPSEATIRIRGTLVLPLDQFEQRFGFTNGIRGWIVSSRGGVLASWTLAYSIDAGMASRDTARRQETNLDNIEVRPGDTIDFVVDSLDDYENDDFTWVPTIEDAAGRRWSASSDFRGPSSAPLSPFEQLAQVILLTNEFAFLD